MVNYQLSLGMNKREKIYLSSALIGLLFGTLAMSLFYFIDHSKDVSDVNHDSKNKIIIVNKETQTLIVYDSFMGIIKSYAISSGENPGNKLMRGDLKTPEGIFPVIGIEDAEDWAYDFKDGKGPVTGAYGPVFFRLKVDSENIFYNVKADFDFTSDSEFLGIGIHGTHLNDVIGTRASHGCIRLKNEDLLDLKQYIAPGTLVSILPGSMDLIENIHMKYIN